MELPLDVGDELLIKRTRFGDRLEHIDLPFKESADALIDLVLAIAVFLLDQQFGEIMVDALRIPINVGYGFKHGGWVISAFGRNEGIVGIHVRLNDTFFRLLRFASGDHDVTKVAVIRGDERGGADVDGGRVVIDGVDMEFGIGFPKAKLDIIAHGDAIAFG